MALSSYVLTLMHEIKTMRGRSIGARRRDARAQENAWP